MHKISKIIISALIIFCSMSATLLVLNYFKEEFVLLKNQNKSNVITGDNNAKDEGVDSVRNNAEIFILRDHAYPNDSMMKSNDSASYPMGVNNKKDSIVNNGDNVAQKANSNDKYLRGGAVIKRNVDENSDNKILVEIKKNKILKDKAIIKNSAASGKRNKSEKKVKYSTKKNPDLVKKANFNKSIVAGSEVKNKPTTKSIQDKTANVDSVGAELSGKKKESSEAVLNKPINEPANNIKSNADSTRKTP